MLEVLSYKEVVCTKIILIVIENSSIFRKKYRNMSCNMLQRIWLIKGKEIKRRKLLFVCLSFFVSADRHIDF